MVFWGPRFLKFPEIFQKDAISIKEIQQMPLEGSTPVDELIPVKPKQEA